MTNKESFIGALVAGILQLIATALFILALGFAAPILAVMVPFYAYYYVNGMFTFAYFFLGGFAVAMFTNILYCRLTFAERKARGETFGQHCRTVAGWPTASILCSWICSCVFYKMFHHLLSYGSSNEDHFTFFALAPIAVFMPTWIYLIHRRRQKAAMEELHRKFEARRRQRDAEFLREQGIVS